MLLNGKVALITGASRGIGRAIAEAFVSQGAAIVIVARSAEIVALADSLRRAGGNVVAVQGDITTDATVRECVNVCRKQFGRLDVLVNNAGVLQQSLLGMIAIEGARELFNANVISTLNLTQVAVRLMKGPASIINISSFAGSHGLPGLSVYSATKAAVSGFTLAAAKELAPRGIRVNAIAPGFIDTEMMRALPQEIFERNAKSIRMGRAGAPLDVANAAVFFGSDLSSYVTGQILGVDGGMQA